ncbi:MAG: choice-of-anchor D domain-containing protein, partial [Chlorobi bacterium]|nr:choice-of-anchor D domain-containing protein [Chlorobiota bacterium]
MRPARFLFSILICILCTAVPAFSQGWTVQFTQTTALWALDFVDTQNGWAVGEHPTGGGQPLPGMIFGTTDGGQNWTMLIQNVPVMNRHFYGVDFIDHLSGWVCGEQGTIIYTSDGGQTWADQTPGITSEDLSDIVFIDPWKGFAVGGNNAGIYSTDGGATWDTLTNLPSGNGLTRIQFVQGRLYTCGDDGQLYYSDDLGMSWFDRSLVGAPRIEGMKWVDVSTGFITLQYGQILMTVDGGMSWRSISPGGFGNLHAVDAIDPNTIITSGQSDLIFHTYDAGVRWHTYSTGLRNRELLDLAFVTSLDAWSCGGRDFGTFLSRGFIAKWDGRAPVIFMPSVHNYDTLLCDVDDVDTLNVRNLGNKDLQLTSWRTVGPNLTEFSIVGPSFPTTIPPGGNVDLLVRWKPAGLGPKTAELQIFNDDPIRSPRRVHLTAYKDSSEIGISRSYIAFRNLCVGYSLEDSIDLFAFGTVNPELISITKVSGDDVFSILEPSTPRVLSFKKSTKIKFRFTPKKLKDYQATYRITATPCNRELYFVLSGQGAATRLDAMPPVIDFGRVELKDSVFREIYVTNLGNYEAKVTRYKLFPDYPNVTLRDSSLLPLNLKPGESKKYTFAFAPDSIHTVNAVLCMYWDEPCLDSVCIPIRGQGVADPRIETDAYLQFPHSLCETSLTDTLWVYNTGHKRLKITSAALVGDAKASFTILDPSIPVSIPPLDSVAFVFKVNHDKPGPKVTRLRLVHNDSVNNPTEVVLVADKDDAIFSVLGDTARVEQVCVGTDFARNFTVKNTGTVPIKITAIKNLTNNINFQFSGLSPGTTIKPGKSRQLRITFSPVTPGIQVLKLQISSSPCDFQHLMTITMQGIETMFSRNPATLNFGDVRIGEQSTLRIHLRNTGANAHVAKILIRPPVTGLSITGAPKAPFTWRAGIQDSIEVRFAPGADGAMNTELLLIVDAACPDTIRIPILGTGTTSYLALSRSALPLLLDGCAFAPGCDTLVVTNTGVSTVRIDSLFIRQAGATFSLQSPPALPMNLSGGNSKVLTICAQPGFIGAEQGRLIVVSDDPQRPRIELPLLATRDSVKLEIDPRTIAFGTAAACD